MMRTASTILLVVLAAGAGWAQQAGFARTVLQQVEISAPGREAITARAEFATVGAAVGRHTHFGEEIGYVSEGAVSIEIDGTTKMVKAGEAFIIPNGKPHNATNAGPGKAVLVITYVVEKGKPLATPVK